jgi:sarcosine oxidase
MAAVSRVFRHRTTGPFSTFQLAGEGTMYDVAVIGAGAMGSAITYHLARRGLKVVTLERYTVPNEIGSSHGLTRIIRLAYFEHPSYVPLLQRAFHLWRDLEQATGERLLVVTGSLDLGPSSSPVVEGSFRSCQAHSLPHEVLDGPAITKRFPAFQVPADYAAVYQPQGGFLAPERCTAAHAALARALGAEIRERTTVAAVEPDERGVTLYADNVRLRARQAILALGPWVAKILPNWATLLVPERQAVGWFAVQQRRRFFQPGRFPVFILDSGLGIYYGFPEHGVPGFKLGKYHHLGENVDPDSMERRFSTADEEVLRECLRHYFPAAQGPLLRGSTCIFTNTPDGHFVLGRLPEAPSVVLVSACAGHGFKFAPVIAEIAADLVERGETEQDISLHRIERFWPERSASQSG